MAEDSHICSLSVFLFCVWVSHKGITKHTFYYSLCKDKNTKVIHMYTYCIILMKNAVVTNFVQTVYIPLCSLY